MSNKTISINPSLFSVGKTKTKRNKEKIKDKIATPIISPNILKNKLLKRIKEHKQRETQNGGEKPSFKPNFGNRSGDEDTKPETETNFSDEFNDSINYLQTLSKQKRVNDEKKNYEIQLQKKREELERRTIRNHNSLNTQPMVNIDLPEELVPVYTQPTVNMESLRINQNRPDDVPYGILKGGNKQTYREWARTQRNNIVTDRNASLVIEGGRVTEKTARENRLNLLKEKIKRKAQEKMNLDSTNIQSSNKPSIITQTPTNIVQRPTPTPIIQTPTPTSIIQTQNHVNINQIQTQIPNTSAGGRLIATKNIIKKTIKKKYTLGKSNIKRKVAVLIKDKGTRKNVISAQKELKRKNINDIKEYLRNHNLIKAGTNAPNDVIRKIYESAMLAGEISNSNSDTLLYNLSKEEKSL